MIRHHRRNLLDGVPGTAHASQRQLVTEECLRRNTTERHDHLRSHELDLLFEIGAASGDFLRFRIPVSRWPALHDVRDVDALALELDRLNDPGQQLAGRADERQSLPILLCSRTLADKHQTGVRIATAEDHGLPSRRQAALLAVGRLCGQRLETPPPVGSFRVVRPTRLFDIGR